MLNNTTTDRGKQVVVEALILERNSFMSEVNRRDAHLALILRERDWTFADIHALLLELNERVESGA